MGISDFWSQSNNGKRFSLEQFKGKENFTLEELSKKLNVDKDLLKSVFIKADSDRSGTIQLANANQEDEVQTFLADLNTTFSTLKKKIANDSRFDEVYEYKDAEGNSVQEFYKNGTIAQKLITKINQKTEEITLLEYKNGRPDKKSEYKDGNVSITTFSYNNEDVPEKSRVYINTFDSFMNQTAIVTEKIDSDGNPQSPVLERLSIDAKEGTQSQFKMEDGKLHEQVFDLQTQKLKYVYTYDENINITNFNSKKHKPKQQTVPNFENIKDSPTVEYDGNENTYIYARIDDTWTKIAKKFNISVQELKALNKNVKEIRGCTKIKVPTMYNADSELLQGRISKDAIKERDKIKKALNQLYISKVDTKVLKGNYKSVYEYAEATLKMRGVKPESTDFKQKRNSLANELTILNGAETKYTQGTKIRVVRGHLNSNLVEEFKNAGIKVCEENQVFFARLQTLDSKQQKNILDVVKDCKSRGISDTKKIHAEILKYYPHLNMFDTEADKLSKPTELDERKYAAEMLIGQIMSIVEGYQGQLSELERNPFNIVAMGGHNIHQHLKDNGIEDMYKKSFKFLFPSLSAVISKTGDLLTKINLVEQWCNNLSKGESKIHLEKGLKERLDKALVLLKEIKTQIANRDADFDTRKRLVSTEKQTFENLYSGYTRGKKLDYQQLEKYLSAARKYQLAPEYHNEQIEKEMADIAEQIDIKFGDRLNRLNSGKGKDEKLESEIKELLKKYHALVKKMDTMPDNKKSQARTKMDAEYKKLNIAGNAFVGLDKRIQDFVEGTSTRGFLTELGTMVALMALTGGGSLMQASSLTAKKATEGAVMNTLRKAGGSVLMKKVENETVKTGLKFLAKGATFTTGWTAFGAVNAVESALFFNIPKAATVGYDIATGDTEHLATDAEALNEGVVGLTEFGFISTLVTGPTGRLLGMGLKAGLTSDVTKRVFASTGMAGKSVKSMRGFLNKLTTVSEGIGSTVAFSATFGLNAGYMTFKDGMEYTQAVISLSQMDGVSKLVVAMLCRNAAAGAIPEFKGRKLTAEQFRKIVEEINKKLEEKKIEFTEEMTDEQKMDVVMAEVVKIVDEKGVNGVNDSSTAELSRKESIPEGSTDKNDILNMARQQNPAVVAEGKVFQEWVSDGLKETQKPPLRVPQSSIEVTELILSDKLCEKLSFRYEQANDVFKEVLNKHRSEIEDLANRYRFNNRAYLQGIIDILSKEFGLDNVKIKAKLDSYSGGGADWHDGTIKICERINDKNELVEMVVHEFVHMLQHREIIAQYGQIGVVYMIANNKTFSPIEKKIYINQILRSSFHKQMLENVKGQRAQNGTLNAYLRKIYLKEGTNPIQTDDIISYTSQLSERVAYRLGANGNKLDIKLKELTDEEAAQLKAENDALETEEGFVWTLDKNGQLNVLGIHAYEPTKDPAVEAERKLGETQQNEPLTPTPLPQGASESDRSVGLDQDNFGLDFSALENNYISVPENFPKNFTKQGLEFKLTDTGYEIFDENGKNLGYCTLADGVEVSPFGLDGTPASWLENGNLKPFLEVGSIFIPEHSKGTGRKAIQALYELSKELGYEGRIHLEQFNEVNGFYTKIGFINDGQQSRFFDPTTEALSKLYKNKHTKDTESIVGQAVTDSKVESENPLAKYSKVCNNIFELHNENLFNDPEKIAKLKNEINDIRTTDPENAEQLQIVVDMFTNPTVDTQVTNKQLDAVANYINNLYKADEANLTNKAINNGFKYYGDFTSRIKSVASLKVKLENYIKDAISDRQKDPQNPVRTLLDAFKDVRDAYACRTEFEPGDFAHHPEVIKILEEGNYSPEAKRAAELRAAELQSQPMVNDLIEMITIAKNIHGDFDVMRLTNYTSKDGIPLFSPVQMEQIIKAGLKNGVKVDFLKPAKDIHPDKNSEFANNVKTKSQPTGYMAVQVNFVTRDGKVIEWQYRGKLCGKLAEAEHPLYDLRTGKCPWALHPELEFLYKPIGVLIHEKAMPEGAYKNHQQYLTDYNTHLRRLELGFESEAPKLEEYEIYTDENGVKQRFRFDKRLTAENLMKLDDIAKAVTAGEISKENSLSAYYKAIGAKELEGGVLDINLDTEFKRTSQRVGFGLDANTAQTTAERRQN